MDSLYSCMKGCGTHSLYLKVPLGQVSDNSLSTCHVQLTQLPKYISHCPCAMKKHHDQQQLREGGSRRTESTMVVRCGVMPGAGSPLITFYSYTEAKAGDGGWQRAGSEVGLLPFKV